VDRWQEEVTLVRHEMHWTTLWFQKQIKTWTDYSIRGEDYLPIGHKAYAVKQQKLWTLFHRKALEKFALYIDQLILK
jgi:hypothetical protein